MTLSLIALTYVMVWAQLSLPQLLVRILGASQRNLLHTPSYQFMNCSPHTVLPWSFLLQLPLSHMCFAQSCLWKPKPSQSPSWTVSITTRKTITQCSELLSSLQSQNDAQELTLAAEKKNVFPLNLLSHVIIWISRQLDSWPDTCITSVCNPGNSGPSTHLILAAQVFSLVPQREQT